MGFGGSTFRCFCCVSGGRQLFFFSLFSFFPLASPTPPPLVQVFGLSLSLFHSFIHSFFLFHFPSLFLSLPVLRTRKTAPKLFVFLKINLVRLQPSLYRVITEFVPSFYRVFTELDWVVEETNGRSGALNQTTPPFSIK